MRFQDKNELRNNYAINNSCYYELINVICLRTDKKKKYQL